MIEILSHDSICSHLGGILLRNTLQLQDIAACSLEIIDNATDFQISAAVEHNRRDIDTLLLKLLTINHIHNNQTNFVNDIKTFQTSDKSQSRFDPGLKTHCNQTLKHYLSPKIGFINENLFTKYNISNDLSVAIVSYIKPIEMHKSLIRLNKHFNAIIRLVKNSPKYNIDESKHYHFESFNNLLNNYFEYGKQIDVRWFDGEWVCDKIEGYNLGEEKLELRNCTIDASQTHRLAPVGYMRHRPTNRYKLCKIAKRSPSSVDWFCDVNIRKYTSKMEAALGGGRFNPMLGRLNSVDDEFDSENFNAWRCGVIDIPDSTNKENGQICVVCVNFNISHVYDETDAIWHHLAKEMVLFDDQYGICDSKWVQIKCRVSDTNEIMPFGTKTTNEEQRKFVAHFFRNGTTVINVCSDYVLCRMLFNL